MPLRISRKHLQSLGVPMPKKAKKPARLWNGCDGDDTGSKTDKEKQSARTNLFIKLCVEHGLEEPVCEYRFAPPRRFRFDFVWGFLALECQGGIYTGGRHVRGAALEKEFEKLNLAVEMGYSVIFCTPRNLESGKACELVKRILGMEQEQS